MDLTTLGIVVFFGLLFLLVIGVPIGFAAFIAAGIGIFIIAGLPGVSLILGTLPHAMGTNYAFIVMPLFMLMGDLGYHAGLTGQAFLVAERWLGRLPGGMYMAVVWASAAFAACSGSSTATAAVMTKVAYPELEKRGGAPWLASGCIAAAGTFAIMIPPSGMMVIYGIITEQSIGRLLIAGIIPGSMTAIAYMIECYAVARLNPRMDAHAKPTTWKARISVLPSVLPLGIVAGIVLGGIYLGWFTATEAGAVGVAVTLLLSLARRGLTWESFKESLKGSAQTTSMIFVIIVGILTFTSFLSLTRLPYIISTFVVELPLSPTVILLVIGVLYIILGMFLDGISILLLTAPILFPAIIQLGFDPIWLGVFFIKVIEIGCATPPIGLNCYVVHAVIPHVPLSDIFKGASLFLVADLGILTLLVFYPEIALFLPGKMT